MKGQMNKYIELINKQMHKHEPSEEKKKRQSFSVASKIIYNVFFTTARKR